MNKNLILPPNYHFSIGDLAFAIRKINGLTQVDYSKRLGVVQSTVSKVEKNIFEDVPFSLVSKISSEFNIPLNYFQAGILPLKKTKTFKSSIPNNYIEEGLFKAKTIFYLLSEIEKTYGEKIYKDLKLPKQLLCLNNLSYSLEFINKIYSLIGNGLIELIRNIPIKASNDCTYQNVYEYLAGIHGLNILDFNIAQTVNSPNKIHFTLPCSEAQIELKELNLIYTEVLKLEMKIIFNAQFSIKKLGQKIQSHGETAPYFELEIL